MGRPDSFVALLCALLRLPLARLIGQRQACALRIGGNVCPAFVVHVRGVGAVVGDRALLIKALRQFHRALGLQLETLTGGLLQRRGGERRGRCPALFAVLVFGDRYVANGGGELGQRGIQQVAFALGQMRFCVPLCFPFGAVVVLENQLGAVVLSDLECGNGPFAVNNKADGRRLHAPRAKALPGGIGQCRADAVANDAVKCPAGFLRVYALHVERARRGEGRKDFFLGDGRERHALGILET